MIAADEIAAAAADAGPDFASAAGIDGDALRAHAIRTFAGGHFAQRALVERWVHDGMPFEAALVASMGGAWCQGFTAGVVAARLEASS